jgi:hypothetical protein
MTNEIQYDFGDTMTWDEVGKDKWHLILEHAHLNLLSVMVNLKQNLHFQKEELGKGNLDCWHSGFVEKVSRPQYIKYLEGQLYSLDKLLFTLSKLRVVLDNPARTGTEEETLHQFFAPKPLDSGVQL